MWHLCNQFRLAMSLLKLYTISRRFNNQLNGSKYLLYAFNNLKRHFKAWRLFGELTLKFMEMGIHNNSWALSFHRQWWFIIYSHRRATDQPTDKTLNFFLNEPTVSLKLLSPCDNNRLSLFFIESLQQKCFFVSQKKSKVKSKRFTRIQIGNWREKSKQKNNMLS